MGGNGRARMGMEGKRKEEKGREGKGMQGKEEKGRKGIDGPPRWHFTFMSVCNR